MSGQASVQKQKKTNHSWIIHFNFLAFESLHTKILINLNCVQTTAKMARKKQLSKETKVQICTLKKEGNTEGEIAKHLKVFNKGVHYTVKRIEEPGSYDDRKRHGRKRVTTKAEDKRSIVISKRDR
ncbi:hypothetical protein NL108_014587 [Xyrichtys novacula]|uniref:Transposase n=1 Tax=Xyrichtys novacula TaxID=13765 RepID=A0AAV1EIJ4_XYRNO|nr:hypothetical protein NL108_014587 [Xyrichtys novacula]